MGKNIVFEMFNLYFVSLVLLIGTAFVVNVAYLRKIRKKNDLILRKHLFLTKSLVDSHQLQMNTILSAINGLVFMCDMKQRIIKCNDAFVCSIEMKRSEIIGRDLKDLKIKLQYKRNKNRKVTCKEGKYSFEASFISAKGSNREMYIQLSSILNSDGKKVGRICICTEITETQELLQKMQQQEKLAMLGQMGASIVHETKNYLAVIKGSSQLLNLIAKDEKVKKFAKKIDVATNEVNRIISDFLLLSKPRELVLNEISINDLLASMKSVIETSALIKGIEAYIVPAIYEQPVLCDDFQIKQVILNISKNAIEALEESISPRVLIGAEPSETGEEMIITISDNGKGMPHEEISKIGTPFFTTKEKGTGLGLSVCYNIIKAHSGIINIESEEGKGTLFMISLPCKTVGKQCSLESVSQSVK